MHTASLRSKLLLTGIELKVFNQLAKPKSAESVAGTIGTNPRNIELFLNSLAAINLLKNGQYRNWDYVVKKVYDALNPGGLFLSLFLCGLTREGTKPETIVLNMLILCFG